MKAEKFADRKTHSNKCLFRSTKFGALNPFMANLSDFGYKPLGKEKAAALQQLFLHLTRSQIDLKESHLGNQDLLE